MQQLDVHYSLVVASSACDSLYRFLTYPVRSYPILVLVLVPVQLIKDTPPFVTVPTAVNNRIIESGPAESGKSFSLVRIES